MMRYPIELRDRIFVKGYGLLVFAKYIDKNISKYSSGILGVHQKLLDDAKQSTKGAVKFASKRKIKKTAESTDDPIGNKIAYKTTKNSPENN